MTSHFHPSVDLPPLLCLSSLRQTNLSKNILFFRSLILTLTLILRITINKWIENTKIFSRPSVQQIRLNLPFNLLSYVFRSILIQWESHQKIAMQLSICLMLSILLVLPRSERHLHFIYLFSSISASSGIFPSLLLRKKINIHWFNVENIPNLRNKKIQESE